MDNIPKGYKKTEIGVIPEDWEVSTITDVLNVYRGGSPRPIETYLTTSIDGINWVKIGDVEKGAKYIYRTEEKIKEEGKKYSREVNVGDFLLSNSMSFGRPYILKTSGCIHDGWLVLQNYNNAFDQEYLYYHLSSDIILNQYRQKASGSSVLNLNKELVGSIKVVIPSKVEQKYVASILSDIDTLIISLEKLIEKKKLIKQGVMQELLTGKRRLKGFSGEWKKVKLKDVLSYEQPTEYIVKSSKYQTKGKYPVLTAGKTFILGYTNEIDSIFTEIPVIIFDDFTTASKYVDFCFKVKSSAMKMLKPKSKNINLRFIYEKMQLIDFVLGDHKRYWISEYSEIEIDIPEYHEQTAIANILSDLDLEIESLKTKHSKLKTIKAGAMQQLLTGKIRLINK